MVGKSIKIDGTAKVEISEIPNQLTVLTIITIFIITIFIATIITITIFITTITIFITTINICNKPMGRGKMTVEFFSALMLFSVCQCFKISGYILYQVYTRHIARISIQDIHGIYRAYVRIYQVYTIGIYQDIQGIYIMCRIHQVHQVIGLDVSRFSGNISHNQESRRIHAPK